MPATTVERWERVATLVDAAVERSAAERSAFLRMECADDTALLAEVTALVTRAEAPSFLDSGALAFAAPVLALAERETTPPEPATGPQAAHHEVAGANGTPYEIERKLGQGGMADVYLAHDTKHDRQVAVKVLHSSLTARVEGARFVREIRLTARLQHPHLLGLVDSGVFGAEAGVLAGRPYYVMPFVEGESLRARLVRGHGAMPDEALRLLREVADALCYAHEQGVVHRDIKPENILMSRGHAMIADFGIAKALFDAHTHDSASDGASDSASGSVMEITTLVGTPAYMAPEQAVAGACVDYRADVYSWGVIAYELLAGRHPFADCTSAREYVAAHSTRIPRPLRDIAPTLPGEVAGLVMRCLAKTPEERPVSSSEILASLDAVRVGATPRAALGAMPRRRIRAGIVWSLGVVLLVGIVAAAAKWSEGRRTMNGAASETIVLGTRDPARDVRAVQDAVDRGGKVLLEGHFAFGSPPTRPIAALLASGWYPPAAEVLVSTGVTISGVRDQHGDMATIDGGTVPFYIDAPGQRVTIRGLRFERPTADAILVHAVSGLEISSSRIDGVVPYAGGGEGIAINTRGEIPMPGSPGEPQNVSGEVLIARNEIDASGGTTRDATTGVLVFSAGRSPDREVQLDIIGNVISNTTASTVNVRRIEGRVRVLGNTLSTSREMAKAGNEAAVRLVNAGSHLMANNTLDCRWPDGTGIAVFSQFAEWPMEHATVEDNDILMSPDAGTQLGDLSVGIGIRGFARNVIVRNNRIRGYGRAALEMSAFRGGVPVDNAFIDNNIDQFHATLADIVVGSGVVRRRIIGPGVILDRGAASSNSRGVTLR